ncbi:MAG: alpha-L-fucosidase [Bacteroidales bacterium]|jgi:alpha-L-fucosidase|nr:alpha-L-fucosidase [Bacteroidales bacterium]
MKRREMIMKSALLSAVPILSSFRHGISAGLPEQAFRITKNLQSPESPGIKRFGDARDWFFEKRFGMFVHWGIYSIPAWHEQHQWRARVPRSEYIKLANEWKPVQFNPDQWLDTLESAGMKYLTVTTKHHDGFCLWDTRQTAFNTMNTPYGKDIIGMLAEACHKRNIPLCLYYSIADWNHPAYPNQGRHHELAGPEPGDKPDWDSYMEFLKLQVRELCTNYGRIDGFWWDMNVPQHKDPSVNEMIRKLQPSAVINNRGFDDGDFGTPERDFDATAAAAGSFERPVEACQSVGMESWGYRKDEDYYTDLHLLRSIDSYLSRDANYLLNVGPTADGVIPETSLNILLRIGKWHASVAESFTNVAPLPQLLVSRDILVTARDKRTVYLHFSKGLPGNGVRLKPLAVLPVRATLLNNGSRVECVVDLVPSEHSNQGKYLRIKNLPSNEMQGTVMVVKLEFGSDLF